MNEISKLELKPINDLLKERFFIPKYQRGYRWGSNQVKALLDDIWEFRTKSQETSIGSFYCLQPVVVSKFGNEWELIDGQQRLTTINIILEYLKGVMSLFEKMNFTIRYETRTQSEIFLKNINLNQKFDNVDYHHICIAYETIDKWFKDRNGIDKSHFLTTLLNDNEAGKNVKVIWYDVTEENKSEKYAIDIFTRLNIGKIPLTNSELVKALFLQKKNFTEDSYYFNQIQISTEWDAIENQLQNDAFWYFIYNPSNPINYDTRIEYIFDLMKEKGPKADMFFTFQAFLDDFEFRDKEAPDIDGLWLDIKNYFQTFQEWYSNYDFYHLIGFLVEFGASIDELKKESRKRDKNSFKELLKVEISKLVTCNIRELNYGDKKIKRLLLLFNIQTLLLSGNKDTRFPFSKYKTDKWDIEHVRSQTDVILSKSNRIDWLLDVLEYFTGIAYEETPERKEELTKSIEKLDVVEKKYSNEIMDFVRTKKINDNAFKKLYDKLTFDYFKEKDFSNKDSIGNLALLDAKTNRSYKNAMFPIKRRTIIFNDMNGNFVPVCTKNVFLKSYSKKLGDVMFWSEDDAKDYTEALEKVLADYTTPIENINE